MPDPISTDDLYGPSNPPVPEGPGTLPARPEADQPLAEIPIEETPEIPMEPQGTGAPRTPYSPPEPKSSFWSNLGVLIIFVGLFGIGVWLSSYVRQYLPNGFVGVTPAQQEVVNAPTATPTPVDPMASWKTYQVISGATKLPISGISFKLPPEVLAPTCDTTTCMSQGTYLSAGTRFTVAPRGAGQLLADFRGSAISDAGGVVFTTKETTVNGHKARVFSGGVSGKTVGGYGFSQMRGYMIEVTPTLSLEMNHFAPNGVIADFEKDDLLFEQIVETLVLPTDTIVPIATSSASEKQ
ncbi:MAG: hypothetical protein UY48_C0007G0012 [Candidatus Gottesmanbacteria bacterium GW2011_GWB1_49_7]|uniref:Uncharacterized protein n=1 Tax=Candidatus Gottesmanbacteria bacterium GW2011_GWB1_49_7 TaxID=1618448 RepID=A0A0G1W2I3_9BACT|nr:MAG: hypothetical protein UY48_C0007G0012 [Candidatus Gottesmanbacteria bacterium GW2011_GWB1_49_7]